MTTLNGVKIPEFANHDQVLDFIDQHKDKLQLQFVESDSQVERNAIYSLVESHNNEFTIVDIKHCVNCGSIEDLDIDWCTNCNDPDE